jgi:hypothetical protein
MTSMHKIQPESCRAEVSFTHALLEALRGGARADAENLVHLGDVADYVSTKVLNRTKENRRPEQRPSLHCAVDARRLPWASSL